MYQTVRTAHPTTTPVHKSSSPEIFTPRLELFSGWFTGYGFTG
jgi:hypothetical protein